MTVSDGPFPGLVIVEEADLPHAALSGERADTWPAFRARLRQHLLPHVELAEPIAVRLAVREVLPRVVASDPWLAPMALRGGRSWQSVVDAAYEATGVLRERGDALPSVAAGEDETAVRAALLERLLFAVDDELARVGLVDPRREAELVAGCVARADAEDVLYAVGAREVRARGMSRWSPPDLALLRAVDAALSRVGGRAEIELPVFDRGFDAERARDPLDLLIDAAAAALDAAPLTQPILPTLGDLSVDGPKGSLSEAPVLVCRAVDAETEGRAVTRVVHAALAHGASSSSITIAWVSRDETSVRATMRLLAEAGISSVDLRGTRALGSHQTALALKGLDLLRQPPLRLAVARLLRSSYVDPRRLSDADEATSGDRLQRNLARALEETATALPEGDRGELEVTTLASVTASPERRARLAGAARRVDVLLSGMASAKTEGDRLCAARELLSGLGLLSSFGALRSGTGALATDGPLGSSTELGLAAAGGDAESLDAFNDSLASLERATTRLGYDRAGGSAETFLHELTWAFERQPAPRRVGTECVRLVDFRDLGAAETELLVIADAHADAWSDSPEPRWLLTPELLGRLRDVGDPALRPLLQCAPGEPLVRLARAAAASRRVVFTVRARDHDGTPLAAAQVVDWLVRSGAPEEVFQPRALPLEPLSPRDARLADLRRAPGDAVSFDPDVARRATLERLREESFGLRLPDDHPLVATLPRGEPFLSALTEETGGGSRPLGASGVERLASCVFRGFVAEVVRPRHHAPVNDLADAREAGILVHAALAAAFRATAGLWRARPRDRAAILGDGLLAADRALEVARRGSRLRRAIAERARAGVQTVLEWSLADEAWDFAVAEEGIGEEGGWGEVVLGEGKEGVRLRGRVDRVDVAHEVPGVRVIDYKRTPSAARDHTAAFGDTRFQLAIYGRAAQAATGLPPLQGIYLPTERLRPGATVRVPDDRWAAAHERVGETSRFERSVLQLVASVRAGEVEVRPHSLDACTYCDFIGVCRKPRFAPVATPDDLDGPSPGEVET